MPAFEDVSFGSSGIRGAFGERITPELALRIGRAASQQAKSVVVGRDARTTSPTLVDALVAGLTASGARVSRLGLVPTPVVGHATRDHELGIMVTASHNPAGDNGFKLFAPDGSALDEHGRQLLLDGIHDPPGHAPWDGVGSARSGAALVDAYVEDVLDAAGPLETEPRIVVDPGNGAASDVAPRLMREAGASVMTLNASPDGTFPGRPSETTPENLGNLAKVVERTDAICGFAHDGDADRVVAVAEDGRVLEGDHVIVLLARALRAESIVVPVDTSRVVQAALPDVDIEITQVGDAFVSERLAAGHGSFGGEPSGAMILPRVSRCPDGPHAALVLARVAARHGGLADLVDELPTYVTLRENAVCPNGAKQHAMASIQSELGALGDVRILDGVRLDTDDGRALVRPSGTEPKLRLTAEAKSEAEAQRIMSLVQGVVDEVLHEVVA